VSGFDIIGDIHAQGTRLEQFLEKLGYHGFSHMDGRKIIFLGDFIDRGAEHAKTLSLVRGLVENGVARAVMGNHEFNAICYAKKAKNGYIRPHTPENTGEMAQFLSEFHFKSREFEEAIDWFSGLPVYIENPDFRVVHACWHQPSIKAVTPHLKTKTRQIRPTGYNAYAQGASNPFYRAARVLLRGIDYDLPKGTYVIDSMGRQRYKSRLLWWGDAAAAGCPNELLEKGSTAPPLPKGSAREVFRLKKQFEYAADVPVFVGHYNIPATPYLTSPRVACVNFKGHLVAYRWNEGDTGLQPDRFVYV
jgi:hypothetical protein